MKISNEHVSMVGLRLNVGLVAKEGDCLYGQEEEGGVAPWAAALSDALLASNCAACFGPCIPPLRVPCQGPCQGTVAYCSLSCRDLDFSLHIHSGECSLLSLILSSTSISSRSCLFDLDANSLHKLPSFPSLGGTCDVRAGLRLLAYHEALHHIAPFLAASSSRLECARLGGLLSNRSSLLRPTPSGEVDETPEMEEEELLMATELREAAMLMHKARYSTSLDPCMCSTSKNIDYVRTADSAHARGHMDAHMDVCTAVDRGSKHLEDMASTHGNDYTRKDVFIATNETTDGNTDTHKDVCIATSRVTLADVAASSMPLLTPAEELLLVEEVICQVFTNGVHIQVDTWFSDGHSYVRLEDLGTAVYGPLLSWINHSCRPNAFYSFDLAGRIPPKSTFKVPVAPDRDVKGLEDAWGLKFFCFPWFEMDGCQGRRHYGPRVFLHSIGKIEGLEPVCISYVDLLQPKSTRRQELWIKYRFNCVCERCNVESANNVDAILQNIGVSEDWLHEEAQRGLSEFLNNDNPLSCCKILEDALMKVLHEAYQNWLYGNALSICVTALESFSHNRGVHFGGHNSCSEVSERQEVQLNLHLMHRLCLDIYMALSSSYKVLATGFNNSRFESSSMYKDNGTEKRKEAECSLASAIYTLVLAATIQYMNDYGEPGMLGIAARSWLQTGEAFVDLILKLDGYFLLDNAPEIQNLFSKLSGDCSESMVSFCEKEFICELKRVLNAYGRLSEAVYPCGSAVDLLRCMITSLWPVLRNISPFLSCIETPFDISKVIFRSSEKQRLILESKDVWICHRPEAFVGALCSLQHGLKLTNICYGFSEKRIVAMRDFLISRFYKTSTG